MKLVPLTPFACKPFASLHNFATAVILVTGLGIIAHYQYLLLNYFYWDDEGVNILVGRLIAHGFRLYSDVFEQHGPLVFAPAAALELFGLFGIKAHRISILVLELFSAAALFFCPVFSQLRDRILFTLVAVGFGTVFLPTVFGIGYNYQLIAGCFCAIILSQYTLPAIIVPDRLTRAHVILGSSFIGLLPLLAISYWPAAGLFFLSSLTSRFWRLSLLSCFLAVVAGLVVTASYSSMIGYFVIHIYYNLVIFPKFQGGVVAFNDPAVYGNAVGGSGSTFVSILGTAVNRVISIPHDSFSYLLADKKGMAWAAYSAVAFPVLWLQDKSRTGLRSILLFGGCLSFLVRGTFIHAVPFYCSCLTLLVVFSEFGNVLAPLPGFRDRVVYMRLKHAVLTTMVVLLLLRLGWFYDRSDTAYFRHELPSLRTSRVATIVRQLTTPSDRVGFYTYHPSGYLISERLPASGNFYYLAHQELYNRNPKFGIKFDICADLRSQKPKLLYVDRWSDETWPKWSEYAACVDELVAADYLRIRDEWLYVRKDLKTATKNLGIEFQED